MTMKDFISALIIRLDRMRYMDQSGLYAMEDVLIDLANKNIQIVFVHLLKQPHYLMENIGIIPDLVPREQIFDHFDQSLIWIKENVKDIY